MQTRKLSFVTFVVGVLLLIGASAFSQTRVERSLTEHTAHNLPSIGSVTVGGQKLSVYRKGNFLVLSDGRSIAIPQNTQTIRVIAGKVFYSTSSFPYFGTVDLTKMAPMGSGYVPPAGRSGYNPAGGPMPDPQ